MVVGRSRERLGMVRRRRVLLMQLMLLLLLMMRQRMMRWWLLLLLWRKGRSRGAGVWRSRAGLSGIHYRRGP